MSDRPYKFEDFYFGLDAVGEEQNERVNRRMAMNDANAKFLEYAEIYYQERLARELEAAPKVYTTCYVSGIIPEEWTTEYDSDHKSQNVEARLMGIKELK